MEENNNIPIDTTKLRLNKPDKNQISEENLQ
jgi:hypothetical protein